MGTQSFFSQMSETLWPRLIPCLRPIAFERDEVVCIQDQECTEFYVVISGSATGEVLVAGDKEPRNVRSIPVGGGVNVLCLLGLWFRSLETVTPKGEMVEAYAVSFSDFQGMFSSESDLHELRELRQAEAQNYHMDPDFPDAPTNFGRPLYFSCFSSVTVSVVQMRDLVLGNSERRLFGGASVVAAFVVADLVDLGTGKPLGPIWRAETQKAPKMMRETEEAFWGESFQWKDVSAPFESVGLRLRIYESDNGRDTLCGVTTLGLAMLEAEGPAAAEWGRLDLTPYGLGSTEVPTPMESANAGGGGGGEIAAESAAEAAAAWRGLVGRPRAGERERWVDLLASPPPAKTPTSPAKAFFGAFASPKSSTTQSRNAGHGKEEEKEALTASGGGLGTAAGATVEFALQVRVQAKRPEKAAGLKKVRVPSESLTRSPLLLQRKNSAAPQSLPGPGGPASPRRRHSFLGSLSSTLPNSGGGGGGGSGTGGSVNPPLSAASPRRRPKPPPAKKQGSKGSDI